MALTLGAGWGAWLLLRIAATGSFTTPSVFAVNAHGQAQIYGWVGLFILGFAYQAFPRFAATRLALAPLARLSLFVMGAGIVLRSLTEPLAPSPWAWLALVGAGFELVAVLMFAAVVGATFRSAGREPRTFDRYILAAATWFVVAVAFDIFHLARLLGAPDREALLAQIATFQLALRDLQIHGVTMMIFGVSLRVFLGRIMPLAVAAPIANVTAAIPVESSALDLEATVADWVRRHPTTLGVFARHGRAGLLSFHPETPALATFDLERTDPGATVRVSYSPDSVPPAPELRHAMAGAVAGDPEAGASFRRLWLDRVRRILEARDQVIEVTTLGIRASTGG